MNTLRIQGLAFSVFAVVLSAVTVTTRPPNQKTELFIMAALIVTLGVPHGALDAVFARRMYGLRSLSSWLVFALAYLTLMLSIILLWKVEPALFLAGFLLVSMAHFAGDPAAGTPRVSRILYGGAIIVLPVILHAQEVKTLFSMLVGATASANVFSYLHLLAWPWLIALICAAAYSLPANWLTAIELAAVGVLGMFCEPLLAFTVFFCGMHSARHILRSFEYSGRREPRQFLVFALAPMLAVLAASLAVFYAFPNLPVETRIVQLVFVGLASLTIPHLILVERAQSTGCLPSPHLPAEPIGMPMMNEQSTHR